MKTTSTVQKASWLVAAVTLLALQGGCGLYETASVELNLDSMNAIDDPNLCAIVHVRNMVRMSIFESGDSVQDTGRSRAVPIKPVIAKYKVFDSTGHVLNHEAETRAAGDTPYGETVELKLELAPGTTIDQLSNPYFKADLFLLPNIDDDGEPSDTGSVYSTDIEAGEGRCGSTYDYTAWNSGRDSEQVTNEPGSTRAITDEELKELYDYKPE